MISVRELQFAYSGGGFRLDIPELDIQSDSKTAVIGPSGSGKTTLLNLMAGIAVPHAGSISINEVEVSQLGDAARRAFRIRNVGLVFQEFELLEHLNVLDNILLSCRINPALRYTRALRERAVELAHDLEIGDKLRRYVRRLSQGERQRVAVCRALLTEPPMLFCDEPTGNLDPSNKQHVLDILVDYVAKTGATLVTVTHDREILPRFDTVIDFKQLQSNREEEA